MMKYALIMFAILLAVPVMADTTFFNYPDVFFIELGGNFSQNVNLSANISQFVVANDIYQETKEATLMSNHDYCDGDTHVKNLSFVNCGVTDSGEVCYNATKLLYEECNSGCNVATGHCFDQDSNFLLGLLIFVMIIASVVLGWKYL